MDNEYETYKMIEQDRQQVVDTSCKQASVEVEGSMGSLEDVLEVLGRFGSNESNLEEDLAPMEELRVVQELDYIFFELLKELF